MAINDPVPGDWVITIDGPAGAGKSTISKRLADQLGYIYLDTGALYRATALWIKSNKVNPDKEDDLKRLCCNLPIVLRHTAAGLTILLNGKEVGKEIRSPEIAMFASYVSAKPIVRNSLLEMQRSISKKGGIVAEGRDMGTVVFPHAQIKFYLDASPEERASRRYKELLLKGSKLTYKQVYEELLKRDADDSNRNLAPLKPAPDAIYIDSTNKTIDEVVDFILTKIKEKKAIGV